jgi:hypothetical protein
VAVVVEVVDTQAVQERVVLYITLPYLLLQVIIVLLLVLVGPRELRQARQVQQMVFKGLLVRA